MGPPSDRLSAGPAQNPHGPLPVFNLLGPLLVRRGQRVITVTAPKQRVVLAALLLHRQRIVAVGDLAVAVWGQLPPPSAQVTLRNYVRRLRVTLADADPPRIVTSPQQGY